MTITRGGAWAGSSSTIWPGPRSRRASWASRPRCSRATRACAGRWPRALRRWTPPTAPGRPSSSWISRTAAARATRACGGEASMLPREHGSWAMVVAPALVGWAAAGGGSAAVGALFVLALFGAFLARTPLTALVSDPSDPRARRWLAVYSAAAAAGLVGLVAGYGRWGILPLGVPGAAVMAASLWYAARKRAMTEAHELLGVAGLCLGAPGAYYAAAGAWAPEAAWAWALCALFLSGPVFHVKMLVANRIASVPAPAPGAAERADRAAAQSAAYHGAAAAAVLGGVVFGPLPAVAVLPFAGILAKTLYYGAHRGARLELKKVGWQEVGWTLVFVAVSAAGFRG
ncbi:hypothetical protein EPO15_16200 [bacterium]|nr:MAG: hypothetical protein EPO15_16200 [bacterium]